ncbi:glycerol-3-phosphate cytidylyltransferase [Rheinheimera mesophila]|uniref:Glycerol-3-phosphate cytidylyltransferase n=1 Tax=Rheinheimera mesophila TaxID=1547515 RepID=A0A3P3QQ88_9GAMM|nr:glycerol-3-phosphate cytidylyltransferase [Rheinheimera mesophila]KKL01547.1 glycerol-3-phosphate cytidylyltransferase [Rheinheimera mesophila]RRJ23195.1 glycerol-3-phosphate cytidylyltransferase [Rheinheimera mesophila]
MKTVLTYGTFDLFHIGHLNLLKRARELGDKLIVAVSTDEFNATKGKTTLMPFEHRVELVRSVRFVDEVIAESNWEQKISDVQQHKVDVFVMGSDWQGKFDFLKPYCDVVYLPRTDNVSSTELKKAIQVFMQLKRDFLD